MNDIQKIKAFALKNKDTIDVHVHMLSPLYRTVLALYKREIRDAAFNRRKTQPIIRP